MLLFLQRTWKRPWVQVLLLDTLLFAGWDAMYDNWTDLCLNTFVPFLLVFNLTAAGVAAYCRSPLWRWLVANAFVTPATVLIVLGYMLVAGYVSL